MSDGMGRELAYLSSHATNRYFIPNWGKAILFGSRVKGIHKPFSDVDIVLVGEALSLTDLLHLKNEIDDLLLPYEFDFCIYKDLKDEEFKSHIDRRGVEVYDSSRWRK